MIQKTVTKSEHVYTHKNLLFLLQSYMKSTQSAKTTGNATFFHLKKS